MNPHRDALDGESQSNRLVTRRTALKTLGTVGVIAGGLSVGAPVAQARRGDSIPIDSCTTITEPGRYHLVSDIASTEDAPCIEIRSSGVTLDGRGHTLTGKRLFDSIGVLVHDESTTLSDVVITNLTVTTWNNGIQLRDAVDCTVTNNIITNCGTGVFLPLSGSNARIVSNTISETGQGIYLKGSSGYIARNTVTAGDFTGIDLFASTADIVQNVTENCGTSGIYLSNSSNSRLTKNQSRGSRNGITLTSVSKNNSLVNNVASDNDEYGIFLDALSDSSDDATSGNRLVNNVVTDNGDDGINLGKGGQNRLVRNTVQNNGGDGIELDRSDENTLIANVVCDNAGEQIVVRDPFPPGVISNTFRANKTACRPASRK